MKSLPQLGTKVYLFDIKKGIKSGTVTGINKYTGRVQLDDNIDWEHYSSLYEDEREAISDSIKMLEHLITVDIEEVHNTEDLLRIKKEELNYDRDLLNKLVEMSKELSDE